MSAHRVLYDLFRAPALITNPPGDGETYTVDRQFSVIPLTTGSSGETRVLAQPTKAGLVCTIVLDTDGGGDAVVTVTGGYNADAATAITLADAGDFVTLISVKIGTSFYWRVLAQEGTNVAMEDLSVDQLTVGTLTVGTTAVVPGNMTPGTGISTGTGTICEHMVYKIGDVFKTEILLDLTGLNSSAAADVIGKQATANCHIGQITAAVNGAIVAGKMTCLEAPIGGEPDIDLYGSNVATGTEDVAISHADLGTEEALLDAGADWAIGDVKVLTGMPTANNYLYLVGSGDGTDAIYTAGKFLIELWGK